MKVMFKGLSIALAVSFLFSNILPHRVTHLKTSIFLHDLYGSFHGFRALEAPAELPHRSHRFQEAPQKIVKGTARS